MSLESFPKPQGKQLDMFVNTNLEVEESFSELTERIRKEHFGLFEYHKTSADSTAAIINAKYGDKVFAEVHTAVDQMRRQGYRIILKHPQGAHDIQ